MASVTLRGISKTFESAKAPTIADLDLDVADGEFMVLVGPSGCGKSTTLRMIAGLEDPSAGEIRIGDRVVNEVAPKDRDIAMVFQNYALYPHMSVRENLAFGLKLRKVPKPEIAARVAETASLLEIDEYLDRKPRALSGGQRQRVALGRAIIRKPTVFLFDEPLSNLDAKLRVAMRTEIKKLHYQLGTTMIYVTHDQVEAMTMGDRICVMRAGVIHQVDTPLELYARPADMFVAGFIGNPAMNFLRLRVMGDGLVSADGALRLPVPPALAERLRSRQGGEIVLGLRPEHISTDGTGGAPAPVDALHDVSELLGNEMILYLMAGSERIVARTGAAAPLRPGEALRVWLDMEQAHCFDAATERRI